MSTEKKTETMKQQPQTKAKDRTKKGEAELTEKELGKITGGAAMKSGK